MLITQLTRELKKIKTGESVYIGFVGGGADWSEFMEIKNIPFYDGDFEVIVAFQHHIGFSKSWILDGGETKNRNYIRIARDIVAECEIKEIEIE